MLGIQPGDTGDRQEKEIVNNEQEEEESLISCELTDLQKENVLPLEELLAVYACPLRNDDTVENSSYPADNTRCCTTEDSSSCTMNSSCCTPAAAQCSTSPHSSCAEQSTSEHNETYSSSEEEILSNQDLTLDKDEIARDLLMRNDNMDHETSVNDLITIIDLKSPVPAEPLSNIDDSLMMDLNRPATTAVTSATASFFSMNSSTSCAEDDLSDESDCAPESDDSWVKAVSIGSEFQANIPEVVLDVDIHSDDVSVDEHLMWDPSGLSSQEVELYGERINQLTHSQDVSGSSVAVSSDSCATSVPSNSASNCCSTNSSMPLCIRDNEQALYLLLQCKYNVSEALRRRQMEPITPSDPLNEWTVEERSSFVNGLRLYGKDFHLIQRNKVRTKSVSELVQFYYQWKKTEHYSTVTHRDRERDKTKTTSTSNVASETVHTVCDDSTTWTHSLLYTDHKRCQMSHDNALSHDTLSHDNMLSHDTWHDFPHVNEPTDFHSPCHQTYSAIDSAHIGYHEPYTDVDNQSHMSPIAHYRHSINGFGGGPVGCSLGASPYHESYVEPLLSYGPDTYSMAADPSGCSLSYYLHHRDTYMSDLGTAQTTCYPDNRYQPPAQAFYSHSLLHPSCKDETAPLQYLTTEAQSHTSNDFSAGMEPCAKRFKSSNVDVMTSNVDAMSPTVGCLYASGCASDIGAVVEDELPAKSFYDAAAMTNHFALGLHGHELNNAAMCLSQRFGAKLEHHTMSNTAGKIAHGMDYHHVMLAQTNDLQGINHADDSLHNSTGYTTFGCALQNVTT